MLIESNAIEGLHVSLAAFIFLSKLGIKSAAGPSYEVEDIIEYDFASCCNSRIKYCECERVRKMRPQ